MSLAQYRQSPKLDTLLNYPQTSRFILFSARNEEKGLAACEQLKKEGLQPPTFYQLDITDRAQIIEFRQHLQKAYGGIDVLINNASVPHKVCLQIENSKWFVYCRGGVVPGGKLSRGPNLRRCPKMFEL